MSIQSEINRIAGAKSDIADAIEDKGVTVPSGTKLDGMANLIGQISGGSGKLNSTQAADAYDPTATYAVGDKVSYAGNVYSCISAISTPEAWDSTHWDQVDPIQDQVDDVRNTLNSEIATRQTYVRPNLLDNWYFINPVNQREQTSYSNAGYTIDRWKLTSGSAEVVSGGITLNGTLVQILEASIGQTVTASALLSDGTMITPTYNDTTKTFTMTATGQTIKAVKLELGSGQTLAHNEGTEANPVWVLNQIPNYGEELFKCGTSTADSADPYANKTYNKVFSAKNRIEASEDFDNYRGINAIGFYIVSGTPTNAPAGFGTLLVFQSASSIGCTQMYLAQGKIFMRQYGGSPPSWGSWKSISLS